MPGNIAPPFNVWNALIEGARSVTDWGGAAPRTVVNNSNNAAYRGATVLPSYGLFGGNGGMAPPRPDMGAVGLAVPPDRTATDPAYHVTRPQPVMVKPLTGPSLHAIDPLRLARILYHETAGQRELPGGASLDAVRRPMANAIVTGYDQGKNSNPNYTATPEYAGRHEIGDMLAGILNGRGSAAGTAFYSTLNAALEAVNRFATPASGAGSGPYFRGLPVDPNNPKNPENYHKPWGREAYLDSLGPYKTGDGNPYWAFYDEPKSGS